MDMAYLEKVVFFYDFYGFGGLRSTQPTNYIRVLSYSKTFKEVRHLRKLRFRIMKRYPEYKESGVEWIGKIPHHWEVLKAKHVGSSNPSKNNPKTTCLKNEPVVFLPMERVHTDGTIDQELRLPYSQLKNGYTYFEEGDILIAKVTPLDQEKLRIANFLDRKTEQINELIIAEKRKIKLLKEYRQSLISEAVTGKIDVRNEV